MRLALWVTSLATVAFLSCWPFTFDLARANADAWLGLALSWGWATSPGDAAGNFALFVPVGLLGVLALKCLPRGTRAVTVALVAFTVAVGAQAAQVMIPGRLATMVDVVWNMAGLLTGLTLGLPFADAMGRASGLGRRIFPFPWLILSTWIAYRLAPFVPSGDLQLIKDNLKPLLLDPAFEGSRTVVEAAAWLAAGYLMRAGDSERRLDVLLPALAAGTLGLEVLIAHRDGIALDNLMGAGAGLLLWFALVRHRARPALLVLPAVALAIAMNGLWPFSFEAAAVERFRLMPFAGILTGNMWLNLLALTEKLFLYAAASFALHDLWGSWRLAVAAGGSFVLAIELLQQYQTTHVPEITDVLVIVVVCAIGFVVTAEARKA